MKYSPLISQEAPVLHAGDAYYVFARGYESCSRKKPAHIAWILESEAARDGWAVGRLVGSERNLMNRFCASRDTVREAIRVLESRGSMLMQRGRTGGLRLAQPDLDWAAEGFATFLRASGFSDAMLHETVAVAEPLLAQMPGDNLIVQLYRRTLELLALSETGHARLKVRGFYITAQLIERYAPIPAEGVVLGSEDLLCEKFSTCRATFRHALRILDDLGMLHVQRGRGGGYVLKRPHSIAVVRQMFALLAWQQQTFSDILPMKWTFDIIRVRLAMLSLGRCEPGIRKAHYDEFSLSLSQPTEPGRWCLLQQALGRAADNPLIGTFLWCLVAYQVRIGAPPVAWSEIETELFGIEQAMVCAVRGGQSADAECQHRRAQALITRLLLER